MCESAFLAYAINLNIIELLSIKNISCSREIHVILFCGLGDKRPYSRLARSELWCGFKYNSDKILSDCIENSLQVASFHSRSSQQI